MMHRAHGAPGHTCDSPCHTQLWGRAKPTVNVSHSTIWDPFSPAATKALNYPEPRKGFAYDTSIYLGKTVRDKPVSHGLNRERIPRVRPLGIRHRIQRKCFFFFLFCVLFQ